MPVREATPADVTAIVAMVRAHVAEEPVAARCELDELSCGAALFGESASLRALVAFPEAEPEMSAGCTLWWPTFSSWAATHGAWVEDLYVRPQYRRLGLATEMLRSLRAMVDGRIEWDVYITNHAAQQLYVRLGAGPVAEWTKYRWLP